MKTAREWFKLLNSADRETAIKCAEKEGNLDKQYPTLYDALLFAFDWESTTQKSWYWNGVHNWIADNYGTFID